MDLQQVAFSALLPNVKIIENFYNVAAKVAAYLPKIASELSTPDKFAEDPALANLLLELLIKIYTVDQKKMMCPGLQNDFSFYRRSVGKFTSQAPVSETVAGQISMWIADAAPLISVVSNSLKTASKKDMNVILPFSKMANMTAWMIVKDNELETAQVEQLLLALTSAIILFDRASRAGAFENSPALHKTQSSTLL